MRIFILRLAWIFSLLGIFVLILVGVAVLLSGKFFAAFLCLSGIPVALAHMIVFDYVRVRLAQPAAGAPLCHDTLGTPWQNNPGHTL